MNHMLIRFWCNSDIKYFYMARLKVGDCAVFLYNLGSYVFWLQNLCGAVEQGCKFTYARSPVAIRIM